MRWLGVRRHGVARTGAGAAENRLWRHPDAPRQRRRLSTPRPMVPCDPLAHAAAEYAACEELSAEAQRAAKCGQSQGPARRTERLPHAAGVLPMHAAIIDKCCCRQRRRESQQRRAKPCQSSPLGAQGQTPLHLRRGPQPQHPEACASDWLGTGGERTSRLCSAITAAIPRAIALGRPSPSSHSSRAEAFAPA